MKTYKNNKQMKAQYNKQMKAQKANYRTTTKTESTEQRTVTISRYSKAQRTATQKAQKAHKEIIRKVEQLKKNREKKAVNDSVKRETLKDVFAKIALMQDSDVRFMKDSSTAVRFFNKVMFRVAVTNSKLYRIYSIESVTDNIKTKFDLHIKAKSRYTAKNNLTESETVNIINEMLAVIC